MIESTHPSGEHLAAYAVGRVTARESIEIERHLAACTACAEHLETIPDDAVVTLVKQTFATMPTKRIITRSEYGECRTIAQGGLGFIALARDQVFGRDVAIKRILPEGADDQSRRKRFLREAAITGRLEHPGIAPVYGIGEDEAGRPCYAMRFVPGMTLQDSIKQLHSNGLVTATQLRPLLSRFISLCNTVAYAHSRGVIHRDIKPANVAIGEYGETILLDWGLAQTEDVASNESSSQSNEPRTPYDQFETKTGTILGTPGYMAPEQVAGEHVGPTADVYSLGATLVAILTGNKPVEFKQSTRGPATLRAIAAKAMEYQATDRYASASDLACEIESWLNDEQVKAYPEPYTVRLRRYLRRHYTAATVAVALLFVTAVALGIGTVLLNREQEKTNQALIEKTNAVIAEGEQRKKAEDAQTQTLEDFRASTDDAIEKLIGIQPELGPRERTYIENTVKRWQKLAERQGDDEKSLAIRAEGHFRVAILWHRLGRIEESRGEYVAAVQAYQQVATDHPQQSEYGINLAKAHGNLGTVLRDLGKREEAVTEFQQALEMQRKQLRANPQQQHLRRDIAATLSNLSNLQDFLGIQIDAQKSSEEARDLLLETMRAEPDNVSSWQLLAGTLHNLGTIFESTGQYDRATQEFNASRKLREQLVAKFPGSLDHRQELVQSIIAQGVLSRNQNRREQAITELQSARDLLLAMVSEYPSKLELSDSLALCRNNLGAILFESKQIDAAIKELHAAQDLLRKMTEQAPLVIAFRRRQAASHNDLGMVYKASGQRDNARKEFTKAIDGFSNILRTQPNDMQSSINLGGVQCGMGQLTIGTKQYDECLFWYDQALATLKPLIERYPGNATIREYLHNTYEGRALCLYNMNRFKDSFTDWEQAILHSTKSQLDHTRIMRARTWFRAGKEDAAIKELEALAKSDSRDASFWYDLSCFFAATSLRVTEERAALERQALTTLRKCIRLGYQDIARIETNVDFKKLSAQEELRQIVAEMKANATTSK